MANYIDKDALVAEIDNRIKKYTLLQQKPEMSDLQEELQNKIDCLNSIKGYTLNTIEVKEVNLQEEPASEDLEEEIRRYMDNAPTRTDLGQRYKDISIVELARHFANWQKQQMMKDAVDGEIVIKCLDQMLIAKSEILNDDKFKWGDKVKLIIIKED